MVQWGACRRVFISKHGDANAQISSNTVEKDGDEETMVADSHLTEDRLKSKRLRSHPRQKPNAVKSEKLWDSSCQVFINQQGEHNKHPPSVISSLPPFGIVKNEDKTYDETVTAEPLVLEGRLKRKHTCPSKFQEMDLARNQRQRERHHCQSNKKNKVKSCVSRWSEDR